MAERPKGKSRANPGGLCRCDRACMLTTADRYHTRTRCRYRHGEVKPVSYFIPVERGS